MQPLFAVHDLQILHHGSYLSGNDHGLLRVRLRKEHDEFFTSADDDANFSLNVPQNRIIFQDFSSPGSAKTTS
jgi:hypothetical protein